MSAKIVYRHPSHQQLPHIIKTSGGRSSAQMVLQLAQTNQLKPERGDALIFNNTSSEHPGTYQFLQKLKHEIETKHNIPFFWNEMVTIGKIAASSKQGMWSKNHQLVNHHPHEQHPNGYRWKGEVMEHLIAWKGTLPSTLKRICTISMKIHPTYQFIHDWLTHPTEIPARGQNFQMTAQQKWEKYQKVSTNPDTKMGEQEYLRRIQPLIDAPKHHPPQKWADYTNAQIQNRAHVTKTQTDPQTGKPKTIWSHPQPREFIACLGMRADEHTRVQKFTKKYLDDIFTNCHRDDYPIGEQPYFPLHEGKITKTEVLKFWENHHYDLDIPYWAGNCTFCFMKGDILLADGARQNDPQRIPNTPSDFTWWENLEKNNERRHPNGKYFGFKGYQRTDKQSYVNIRSRNQATLFTADQFESLTCECTD